MVELIANTTTRKGRKVKAELDQGHYLTRVKVTDNQLAAVSLTRPTNGTATGTTR